MIARNCSYNSNRFKLCFTFLHWNQFSIIELFATESDYKGIASIVLSQHRLGHIRI